MNRYVVIMAGGAGERFWPLSRQRSPKQLLRLTRSDMSMIEEAIERVTPLVPMERILIITSAILRDAIIGALPNFPAHNVIAEPAKRNTAPCLALACGIIHAREGTDALMAVLTADHFIGNAAEFRSNVSIALDFAETSDALVTLGIPPSRPETGYGYIHVSAPATGTGVVKVDAFKEKPNYDTALEYVVSGEYLWNSGMFFWRTQSLATVMRRVLPDVGNAIDSISESIRGGNQDELQRLFAALPDISIDYGVMERASNVFVLPATFPWDDVGSWDALERMQPLDESNNVLQGDVVAVDASSCVVVNTHTRSHTVAVLGVTGVVVVTTNDATMVCLKDRAQDVKRIVSTLREQNRDDVL